MPWNPIMLVRLRSVGGLVLMTPSPGAAGGAALAPGGGKVGGTPGAAGVAAVTFVARGKVGRGRRLVGPIPARFVPGAVGGKAGRATLDLPTTRFVPPKVGRLVTKGAELADPIRPVTAPEATELGLTPPRTGWLAGAANRGGRFVIGPRPVAEDAGKAPPATRLLIGAAIRAAGFWFVGDRKVGGVGPPGRGALGTLVPSPRTSPGPVEEGGGGAGGGGSLWAEERGGVMTTHAARQTKAKGVFTISF
jgi:hypothetical protein